MEKNERIKPEYSLWQNVGYVLKNLWHWNKRLLFLSAARIPVLVVLPFLGILMPKLVIDCLTEQASSVKLATVIGLTTLGIIVFSFLSQYLNGRIIMEAISIRMNYTALMSKKALDTDYENLENPDGQKKQEKAATATANNSKGTEAIINALILLAANFFGILLYGGLLSILNPLIILFLLATSALGFLAARYAQNYEHKQKDNWTPLDKKINYLIRKCEDFSAGKDIRIYHMIHWFSERFHQLMHHRTVWFNRVEKRNYLADSVVGFLTLIRDGLAYAYLVYLVLSGDLSVADFALYFGMIAGFSTWLSGLTDQFTQIHHMSLEICDVRSYLELPDRFHRGMGVPIPAKEDWPCEIERNQVSFTYPESSGGKTLDQINLKIRRGEKIALVGPNGAGKTTCVKLLCGFYHPGEGHILVNGRDMTAYNRDDYYRLFTAVFQDIHILPVSIARNVAPELTKPVNKERIAKCLNLAGLKEKIDQLPQGIETLMVKEINEGAAQFSGGEQQKLLLARALYKDSPILILDEPTAALDPIAENELYQRYGELTAGRTSIFISHRLSSTRFCDRIVFLDNGKIAECGTHEALMKKNGKYARMYAIQSHYYQDQVQKSASGSD